MIQRLMTVTKARAVASWGVERHLGPVRGYQGSRVANVRYLIGTYALCIQRDDLISCHCSQCLVGFTDMLFPGR